MDNQATMGMTWKTQPPSAIAVLGGTARWSDTRPILSILGCDSHRGKKICLRWHRNVGRKPKLLIQSPYCNQKHIIPEKAFTPSGGHC